jgi:HK97 gp10 family phage protein
MAKVEFKVTLDGLKETFDTLKDLSRTIRNRILRKACTKAAQPLVRLAKQHAPRESGLLRKSIGYVVKTSKKRGTVSFYMGPRSDKGKVVSFRRNDTGKSRTQKRDPRFYKHLIEKGTSHGRAFPFMKPAWQSGNQSAKQILITVITAELAAYRAKQAGKAK